jgi:hypothetical protein
MLAQQMMIVIMMMMLAVEGRGQLAKQQATQICNRMRSTPLLLLLLLLTNMHCTAWPPSTPLWKRHKLRKGMLEELPQLPWQQQQQQQTCCAWLTMSRQPPASPSLRPRHHSCSRQHNTSGSTQQW